MKSTARHSRRRLLAGLRVGAVDSGRYYIKLGRTAMACQFEVFLRSEERRFVPAVHEALDEVDRLEAQLSVYRDSSELTALNRAAFAGPVRVEPRLYDLFRLARRIGDETGGAFDITAGPLIRAWGIFERRGRVPDPAALERARAVTGWDKLELEGFARTIRTGEPNLCDSETGLKAATAILKADEAIAQGRRLEIGRDLYTMA